MANPFGIQQYRSFDFAAFHLQRNASCRRHLRLGLGNLCHYCRDIYILKCKRQSSGLRLAVVEHSVNLFREAIRRLHYGVDIFHSLRRNFTRNSRLQQICKAAYRCQRRAEFIAHICEELAFNGISILQCAIPVTQGLFNVQCVGHIQHGKQRIAVGQRNGRHLEHPAIGKNGLALALGPVGRCHANKFTQRGYLRRAF